MAPRTSSTVRLLSQKSYIRGSSKYCTQRSTFWSQNDTISLTLTTVRTPRCFPSLTVRKVHFYRPAVPYGSATPEHRTREVATTSPWPTSPLFVLPLRKESPPICNRHPPSLKRISFGSPCHSDVGTGSLSPRRLSLRYFSCTL